MSLPPVFDNLSLDSWFKAVTYIGGVLLIFSLFIPTQAVSNGLVSIFGTGMFIYGLGRWKNHKTTSTIAYGGILSTTHRKPDILGLLLEVSGLLIMLYGSGIVLTEYAEFPTFF
jgi:hypothetical protein